MPEPRRPLEYVCMWKCLPFTIHRAQCDPRRGNSHSTALGLDAYCARPGAMARLSRYCGVVGTMRQRWSILGNKLLLHHGLVPNTE